MVTCGLLIQDNAGRRMPLRDTRQGVISNNPGLHRMETISQRKSATSTSSQGPQELDYLHDDKGTKRKTSEMEDTPQSIQLQNLITTRKRGRKTRCPLLEEQETYLQQETNDLCETSGHYSQENAVTCLTERGSTSKKWS